MSGRLRLVLAVVVTAVLLGGAGIYCVVAIVGYQSRSSAVQRAATTSFANASDAGRIVFRNTTPDAGYGVVATVPIDDPSGERAMSAVSCDRVYATAAESMCLRIDRGILTTFSAHLLGPKLDERRSWPLPGIPSRTRISPDGDLVAFTAFVTGEAYASIGFSTATQISAVSGDSYSGTDYGNLEAFTLLIDGRQNTAADRNFWGVTFTTDDNVFYATAATGGTTWLVRGDLAARTLTAISAGVECPSVSPDGTRIAFKQNQTPGTTPYWSAAVMDLATGAITRMPDPHSIDDQIEWLDDDTLLYALPRADVPGDSDVWATAADGSGAARLFIAHASSPSVVRG